MRRVSGFNLWPGAFGGSKDFDRMKRRHPYRSAIVAFSLALAACGTARALTITAIYDSSITNDPNAATIEASINSVITSYETLFLDPINVTVTFATMSGGLGENSHFITTDTYTDFLSKLTSSATSTSDTLSLAGLPVQTNNPVNGNSSITLTTANAQALGIFTGNDSIGGTLLLNTSIMNLSRGGTQNSSKYDLLSTVMHEMDEILGLGSALENGSNGQAAPTGPVEPEDLFRYDQTGARSFTTSASAQAYFSLNGGTHFSALAQFNQISNSTNSGDFGDWNSFSGPHTPQVQDAYATPGVDVNLDAAEKTALDVIGYTLLSTLTWNPSGATSTVPPDGSGTWTAGSGSFWWNGTSNSVWSNAPVQNAQFGTAGTPSSTAYTVTLGSAITVGELTFGNQNYTIKGDAGGLFSLTIDSGILAVANGTVSAPVILGAANAWETVGTATLTVSGNISGGFGLTKQGPGTLILSGSNSYSGGTTVASGILQLNSSTALPNGGNVIVSAGILNMNGQSPTIGNLTFGDGASTSAADVFDSGAPQGSPTLNGNITYTGTFNGGFTYFPAATLSANMQLASGTHHLTTADTSNAAAYDLVITGSLGGPGGLTKDATNSVALTGTNTYSGATIINSGNLYTAGVNTLSASSAITVNSPGILNLNPTSAQTLVAVGSYNQTIGSLAGNGEVIVGAATLTIGNDGTSPTYSGSIVDFGAGGNVTKIGAGSLILTGSSFYSGTTTINAGVLQLGSGGSTGFIGSTSLITGLAAGTLLFDYSTNPVISTPIGGAVNVSEEGGGFVFLTGNNNYSGTTTISAPGGFVIGNDGTTGSLGTGSVMNSGTIYFNHSDTLVVSSPMSGSGGIVQESAGGVTLTGTNLYLGGTSIQAGTLQIGNGGMTGSLASASAVTVSNGATLAFNRTDSFTVGNIINGSGGVAQNGSGTVTLSGASTSYSGATSVNTGTLLVTGSISGSTATVKSGAELGGAGTVGPVNVMSGGTILPGSSAAPGLFNVKTFTLGSDASGAHLALELGGTTGTNTAGVLYSELAVTGTVTLNGDAKVSLFGGFTPAVNNVFFIILNDGADAISGAFSNAPGGLLFSGGIEYQVNYAANGDGGAVANDVSLKVLAVPEPSALGLLLAGLVLAAGGKRHRRARRG